MTRAAPKALSAASRRWLLGLGLVFMGGLALVLFFLLTLATDHRAFEAAGYASLLWLNLAVATVLGLVLL
ncbi:MAG: hypothetical protein LRY31_00075, partial [Burkholderiaceae bacterium]|nr:hypothetical protein [Burkholderiaceae bacterium]